MFDISEIVLTVLMGRLCFAPFYFRKTSPPKNNIFLRADRTDGKILIARDFAYTLIVVYDKYVLAGIILETNGLSDHIAMIYYILYKQYC